uniref:Uncharacterized protein n=1 Tax=Nelumbo nucifera TaxID=4432 RepID=A0A822YGM9_NELNU|nr:TPA_asm: hypothetical protein HUJ06_010144 [Nelumbo nucifera]
MSNPALKTLQAKQPKHRQFSDRGASSCSCVNINVQMLAAKTLKFNLTLRYSL